MFRKASAPLPVAAHPALCAAPEAALTLAPNRALRARVLSLATSKGALSLALMGVAVACGVHPAHAADTGTVDTYTLDSGVFNGVVTASGTYLNHLIQYFGVPAILVSLAISGWAFLRHIAKSAFH